MNKTKLIINRVIIKSHSKTVYNEKFHKGLNVIRGYNGTGKSTIMELISYGLGGDIKKHSWKGEALACSNVSVALELNGQPYVFKRAIEGESSRPQIEIFEGSYEDSIKEGAHWTYYKNSKSESRKSYSMQIFELLGLQQHNTADSESLTMHQFLRILYIDQDTPASKIFRTEPFSYDKESMRQAIGEYAFGFDDLEVHALRQKLYEANKAFDKLHNELTTVFKILGQTNIKASSKEIDSEIQSLHQDLLALTVGLNADTTEGEINSDKELTLKSNELKVQISKHAKVLADLNTEFVSVNYEIAESLEFLESLDLRKQSLEHAKSTSLSIKNLNFKYCPSCMEEISLNEDKHQCSLCHSISGKDKLNETYIQALNELDFQISETRQMLAIQQQFRAKLEAEIKDKNQTSEQLRANYNEVNSFTRDIEVKIANYANQKGYIEAQIENLKDKLDLASELDSKIKNKEELQASISRLESKLTWLDSSRKQRIKHVKREISKKVIDILSKEDGIEPAFSEAQEFDFDFATDSIRLDNRANFSASSNVVLKNAFHLAALLTAVNDNLFRIPCFSMFDNIEDKGMREDRSQIFQRTLAELTGEIETDFQVIMTTSMVDPTLNNDTYGVGPYYEKGVHTLNM